MPASTFRLGIIEGFYGRAWTWPQRRQTIDALAPHGYCFHLVAPKADPWLRRGWRETAGPGYLAALSDYAAHCGRQAISFGVGLSPNEFDYAAGSADWSHLRAKLDCLVEAGIGELALLFDDIRGDDPRLAARQARLVSAVRDRCPTLPLTVCPTYYADDPVLDRVFGERPADYLGTLGRLLPADVDVFWTGEEVCSREYSAAPLRRVAEQLQRAPVLWDNYPVNDGQRMSQYLHLRAFTGRSASLAPLLRGHAINPALQPVLTRIPALTLAWRYDEGEADWAAGAAFARACRHVLGDELGRMVRDDLIALQDTGLDRLQEQALRLRTRYESIDHPGAREIVLWLDGHWRITDEIVRTQ